VRPTLTLLAACLVVAGCGAAEPDPPHTVTAGHTVYTSVVLPTAVEQIAGWRGVDPATIREVYPGVWADQNGDLYGGCATLYAATLDHDFNAPPRTAASIGDRCY